MKDVVAMMFLVGSLTLMNLQEKPPNGRADPSSVGPQIDEKAPAFAARDQFGREQTNETLRGSKGTVLLFFRSADW